ncbi:hypothetical protein BOTBODRAFT_100466 [Botryobasidium botryosum FD-172 SS1]|uniref:Midasin n=1 Tax=Botryobasidium botryosum (strain FD-172 SS1) TaxID=930990 RepID=A0A067N9U2_BOTB1|nr:hypothetical protein BOTBODRAFT_100466 [Botryobasidium botryosum FD-172 SS1]
MAPKRSPTLSSSSDWETLKNISDPCAINLPHLCTALLSKLPESHIPAAHLLLLRQTASLTSPPCPFPASNVLSALSELLSIPAFTIVVATVFRPLVLDLCLRMADDDNIDEVKKLEALALLLSLHEEIFPILASFLQQPSCEHGPLGFIYVLPNPASVVPEILPTSLHRILLSCYRVLRVCPNQLWPLAPLSVLIHNHPDPGVRLLAVRCYALQTAMGDAEREKLETQVLGENCGVDAQIEVGDEVALINGGEVIRPVEWDGWVLLVLEVKRIVDWKNSLSNTEVDYFGAQSGGMLNSYLSPADFSPRIAHVEGILAFRTTPLLAPLTNLIPTATTTTALRALILHLAERLPTLLTSPPGSGKSLLLTHLATRLHNPDESTHVVTVHLSDTSLDPKALFGSYVSSPTNPGVFEYVPGALTRALKEGLWVVLEDIDKASGEILGTLLPLVESLRPNKGVGTRASIEVHGRGRIEAADGFALFATRSVNPSPISSSFPPPTFLGHQHWTEIIMHAPSVAEQQIILSARFPKLAGSPIRSLLTVWEAIKVAGAALASKGREAGFRDLEKWANRVELLLPPGFSPIAEQDSAMDIDGQETGPMLAASAFTNPSLRENIFLEARDIFFGSLGPTSASYAATLSTVIAKNFDLDAERVEWVLNRRTPEYVVEKSDSDGQVSSVWIGRIKLPARPSTSALIHESAIRPFALHRPSLTLLERLAVCVHLREPALLVGETGTGKTSTIQHIAALLSHPLTVINLSNQTESADLLGGYKPLDARVPAAALQERFSMLFDATFSAKKNAEYSDALRKAIRGVKWKRVVAMWREAKAKAVKRLITREEKTALDASTSRKRRKTDGAETSLVTERDWNLFESDVAEFEAHHVFAKSKFVFSFVEGPLVKAIRAGHWILLDEINLASPETLEAISPLLQSPSASITLTEQGSVAPVPRHPSFRLFGSMNPATDVGKKDLAPNLRSRFTEIWVPPPDDDREALVAIVKQYIGHCSLGDRAAVLDVAEFYASMRKLAETREIADGSNKRPHFSMRTLARALTFTSDVASSFGLRRGLWEGCLMAFTMALDKKSAEIVRPLAERYILAGVKNVNGLLSQVPALPPGSATRDDFVQVGPFWLHRGSRPLETADEYILTPSVQTKLIDLARIILTRRFPVLIEGPTSAGKTSAIEYLARRTGHRFVRINNHEHTDIQEYIGAYVSDPESGKLVFQDGILVRALRNGDWIVLDELNLAPTDVLEALNRLLDDNRELIIPETQEIVRPHPEFMLFATQNPPGLYVGRKVLSRAFRNRFLEVHFDDVPQAELETILCQRCRIAPSYGQRIVAVFRELQKRRQTGRVFETKQGFATLRDLFRWAGRDAVGYQQLAENGYMLLAERTRRPDDKAVVKEVIESIMKVRIDEATLYSLDMPGLDIREKLGCLIPTSSTIVWTSAAQRLFVLVANAIRYNEPVLLVGETGSGKTSVCELLAEALGKQLYTVNCHQNTETADLLGGQRPLRNRAALRTEACAQARTSLQTLGIDFADTTEEVDSFIMLIDAAIANKSSPPETVPTLRQLRRELQRSMALFEWQDGPLVQAMRSGDLFLLDEISLADDSVLERINSVLEPSRTLVLAERGGWDLDAVQVVAAEGFKLLSTMNPGGDYGKKELSPALRNRFTEIWVPPVYERDDLSKILRQSWRHPSLELHTAPLLDFTAWLASVFDDKSVIGLRDLLAWATFANEAYEARNISITADLLFHHAAHMTFLDGLGSIIQTSGYTDGALRELHSRAVAKLYELVPLPEAMTALLQSRLVADGASHLSIGLFGIAKGPEPVNGVGFSLLAPTTCDNAFRVIRACQVRKPILLEGSPGVGKTSLITALANLAGRRLCRVNLSDQTDLMDLFGSDLPVEDGKPGEFVWKDAAFLRALQDGDWVLLDEMNLAPQAVLEGLNAVLDHRGTVYIPELGRSFIRHPEFRIFAAQNPLHQGGGRKGLPKSFLNRFTKVFVRELSPEDLFIICHSMFPDHPTDELRLMITFNTRLHQETMIKKSFGREGSPWEFNLRDIIRWITLMRTSPELNLRRHPIEHLGTVYLQRFRSQLDRDRILTLFFDVFGTTSDFTLRPLPNVTPYHVQVGHSWVSRRSDHPSLSRSRVLQSQLASLEAISKCVASAWLVIIGGPSGSGKTSMARLLADMTGARLHEFSMNSAVDTMDLLGSFEQVDHATQFTDLLHQLIGLAEARLRTAAGSSHPALEPTQTIKKAVLHSWKGMSQIEIAALARRVLGLLGDAAEGADERFALMSAFDRIMAGGQGPGFQWVDGPLVNALKNGDWLLLDNANLCSPSVLDRLNSLCENSGCLVLSERGLVNGEVQILHPHPNFRLVMALDPRHGELSRAMRNRGIEISLAPIDSNAEITYSQPEEIFPFGPTQLKSLDRHYLGSQILRRSLRLTEEPAPPVVTHYAHTPLQELGSALLLKFMDLIPSLSGFSQLHLNACISFLIQATPIPMLKALRRSITALFPTKDIETQTFIASLPGHAEIGPVLGLVRLVRAELCKLRGVPLRFLELQVSTDKMIFRGPSPLHISFELFVRLRVAEREAIQQTKGLDLTILDKSRLASTGRPITGEVHPAVYGIVPLTLAVKSTARSVLESLTDGLGADVTMLDLLDHVQHLEKTASSTYFDFSSIRFIATEIVQSLGEKPRFPDILDCATSLSGAMRLTSGHGMQEIWRALLPHSCSGAHAAQIARLDLLVQQLEPGKELRGLRADIEDVHSLAVAELGAIAPLYLDSNGSAKVGALACPICPLNHIFSCLQKSQELLELACRIPRYSLSRLTALQRASWALDASPGEMLSSEIAISIQNSWLRSLWPSSESNSDNPKVCMVAATLVSGLIISIAAARRPCPHLPDWKSRSLADLVDFKAGLARQFTFNSALGNDTHDRTIPITIMLLSFIDVVSCQSESESDAHTTTYTMVPSLRAYSRNPTAEKLAAKYLHASWLVGESYTRLKPCLRSWVFASSCTWIALSRTMIELYLPDAPLDPLVAQLRALEHWQQKEDWLLAQISVFTQAEAKDTGNLQSPALTALRRRLEEAQHNLSRVEVAQTPRTSDIARLHSLYSEVSQFRSQMLATSKVDALISGLQLASGAQHLPQEKMLQGSISGFLQRLDTAYSDHSDLVQPLNLVLSQFQFGLRLAARVAEGFSHSHEDHILQAARTLVASPSILGASTVCKLDLAGLIRATSSSIPSFRWFLLSLSALLFDVEAGVDMSNSIHDIERHYDQVLHLWSLDREKKAKEEEEAQSLYRRKAHDELVLSDEEVEERDFRLLFPDFADAFEPSASTSAPPTSLAFYVDPQSLRDLYHTHDRLFGSKSSGRRPGADFRAWRESTVEHLVSNHMTSLSDVLDSESLGYRYAILGNREDDMSGSCVTQILPHNFYHDPNISEARKAVDVLQHLHHRLSILIEEWPDQMVLQHLLTRCDNVLGLGLQSSLAKILAAIEQLIMQVEDWEIYASRHNTLKPQQHALSGLIVEWRRLELSYWAQLLESQSISFASEAGDWWFRLYEAAVKGVVSSVHEGGQVHLSGHLSQLADLLDQYMASSSIGQFEVRLGLLQSFACYIEQIAPTKDDLEAGALRRAERLLRTISAYYRLYSKSVTSSLEKQRAPLEKDIQDFIKLASWKDINVHALKQSAQRTHRHLHRCIRKFRDVLRQPAAALFISPAEDGSAETANICPLRTRLPSSPATPHFRTIVGSPSSPHTTNLPRTFQKFQVVLMGVEESCLTKFPGLVDEFAVQIITTVRTLAATSVPAAQAKALIVRKRKAWSDLLKELKRIGLSQNLKPEVLDRQGSRQWLMENAVPIDCAQSISAAIAKADAYCYALMDSLRHLRSSLRAHHPDLPTRELQRAVMFVESSFSYALDSKLLCVSCVFSHRDLDGALQRLSSTQSGNQSHRIAAVTPIPVDNVITTFDRLLNAMDEIAICISRKEHAGLSTTVASTLQSQIMAIKAHGDTLHELRRNLSRTPIMILLNHEATTLREAKAHLEATVVVLSDLLSKEPSIRYLLEPVVHWLRDTAFPPLSPPALQSSASPRKSAEGFVSSLLVVAQGLINRPPRNSEDASDAEESPDGYLRRNSHAMSEITNLLHCEATRERLYQLLTTLSQTPPSSTSAFEEHEQAISIALPFLQRYVSLLREHIAESAEWTKALFKFTHVLCSTVWTLAEKGFCKPPEGEESGEADGKGGIEGTGLGEGTGKENISDQIEDESQVEGLQGEQNEAGEKGEQEEQGEAIEMSEDVGGDLQDVEHGDEEDEGGSDQDEDEVQHDEQIGDLDPLDPDLVDEKMWGDEGADEKKDDDGRANDDKSAQKSKESEVVAKEGDNERKKKGEDEGEAEPEKGEDANDDGIEEDENGEPEGPDLEGAKPDLGAKMDEHVPEANTLDLPDDMDLGQDENANDADADAPDDDDALTEDGHSDTFPEAEDQAPDTKLDLPDHRGKEEEESMDVDQPGVGEKDDENQSMDDDHAGEDVVAKLDMQGGEGDSGGSYNDTSAAVDPPQDTTPTDAEENREKQPDPANTEQGSEGAQGSAVGTTSQSESIQSQAERHSLPNPLRSLGDALKDIRRRIEEIAERSEDDSVLPKTGNSAEEPSKVEYLKEGEEDHEMQALGPAGQDETSKLRDLKITEDEEHADPGAIGEDDMDVEAPELQIPPSFRPLEHPRTSQLDVGVEQALTETQVRQQQTSEPLPADATSADTDEDAPRPTDHVDEGFSQEVELTLKDWLAEGQPETGAGDVWRLYESLTHDLSFALCEQLRLILEPTLATRLKGDYRTGKRLNMKKIIPYIASDFTKDKIWLRRTKPSQREYQVLIALDDSKSMAESHSVHLAFETLALVTKALSRLEAGDVAVARFGKTVDILHGFDGGPFTDVAGARAINTFHFNQSATDVLSLVETSLKVLAEARERRSSSSGSAADLWQLEIIISDGICQSHDQLRNMLRRAAEQRVMIVFVIVDALQRGETVAGQPTQNSILSLNQAAYKNVNGRMEVHMERYLDTFPFEYYVVLRSAEALPEVLSGTLKQFFERISEE